MTTSEQIQLGSPRAVGGARPRRRTLGFLTLASLAIALAVGILLLPEIQDPTVSCSTTDAAACTNTKNWITDRLSRDMVFAEPLPARLVAVDVQDAPDEWKGRPGFRDGDWAALLTMAGREAVLVACYYSSDDMVACNNP